MQMRSPLPYPDDGLSVFGEAGVDSAVTSEAIEREREAGSDKDGARSGLAAWAEARGRPLAARR